MTREKLAAALGALPHDLLRSWADMEELADSLAASEGADSYASQDTDGAARDLRDEVADALLAALDAPAQPVHPEPLRMMSEFEKAAAIERDKQWGEMEAGEAWSERRRSDPLFMAGYDRRGLLNELGWRTPVRLREASEPEGAKK